MHIKEYKPSLLKRLINFLNKKELDSLNDEIKKLREENINLIKQNKHINDEYNILKTNTLNNIYVDKNKIQNIKTINDFDGIKNFINNIRNFYGEQIHLNIILDKKDIDLNEYLYLLDVLGKIILKK